MTFVEFNYYIGDIIKYAQLIEHDIRYIFAGLAQGDFKENLELVFSNRITLGEVVKRLEILDHSDNEHFFSEADYKYLRQITGKRNHYVHEAYLNFIYIKDFEHSKEFELEAKKLEEDHLKLVKLSRIVEENRIKALRIYNRV
ncbi:MAG: hypothetical protein K6G28_04925 [Acholeplasmatales bacterium]|nr:hypothetical protein [Acholeplasmatales bacterium]